VVATASDPGFINASAGVPAYSAAEMRRLLALATAYNGRNLGGKPGVRPGGNQLNVTLAGSTLTVATGLALVEDSGFTTTRGPYWVAVDTAATLTLTAANATNPRKDIVYLRVYDTDEDSSGLRQAIPEYLAGTAAPSPAEPALPAGSIKLATIDVPQSGGGSAVVTMNFAYTVANGGILPVRTTTDRDALSVSEGQAVYVLAGSGGDALYVYDGAAWDYIRGFVICTAATRPAHREGRVIYETDTDRIYTSDGAAWKQLNPGVDIQQASVDTSESTANSTFTDLATSGPAVTLHLEAGQKALVVVEALFYISAAGTNGAVFSFAVSGAATLAAADNNGCETGVASDWVPGAKHTIFTATGAGNYTFTMKYRRVNADTANFKMRRITVEPR
jgi:hypothetical protein